MYVCLCNKVTDSQIRDAVSNGQHSVPALKAALGVANNCGSCLDMTKHILDETLSTLLKDNPDIYYAA